MHQQPVFARAEAFPTGEADAIFVEGLSPPSAPSLTDEQRATSYRHRPRDARVCVGRRQSRVVMLTQYLGGTASGMIGGIARSMAARGTGAHHCGRGIGETHLTRRYRPAAIRRCWRDAVSIS